MLGGGETGALMRSTDWTKTPLGPPERWPQSLRTALSICISSRFPIALYWGPEFLMLYNDALLPMVGANKHPWALGRPAYEVLPEIRGMIEPLFKQVLATGEATWSEDLMLPLLRHAAPEESYFTFTYSPIRDESGAIGGVLCAVLETTDKVIEERRLRLLNALAEATQAKTPAEVCARVATQLARATTDVPFALLYLLDEESGVSTLAGTANMEAGTALSPRSIAPGDGAVWPLEARAGGTLSRAVALADGPGGARGAVVLPIERAGGGTPLGFLVAGQSPLLRSGDSYARFHNLIAASISQAVSNAAAHEAERRRAESLASLDRAKTTFFSNVSHELRTPLTLMLAPIQELLAAPASSPIEPATLSLLHRNAQRLLKLVNTLLEFSRIEAGRVEAIYEPVDLPTLTIDLASSFRAAIERGGVALLVDAPPLGEPVHVDRDMWEKIVLNLLSNAFKFTFEGLIAVRLRLEEKSVRLEVQDTGTGIAAEDLPRLFERFQRIEGARSRSHEGSGIGLALVQELVKLHGGDIRVSSEVGVGTTFEIRIPRGAAHLARQPQRTVRSLPETATRAQVYVDEALRWGAPVAIAPAGLPGTAQRSQERILFADDNADMRDYVAKLLGEHWAVEIVHDGMAALAAIRKSPPDLVLCDVMMPGLDGFALVREMRSDPALRAIPIIILSARAGDEETAKGLSRGANDYISKPFSARDLVLRVASNLAAARSAKELGERERRQRENLYRHFVQAPFPVAVLRGPEHVVELANPKILQAWNRSEEILGLPLAQALPELRGQPFLDELDRVFRSGVPHEGKAELARLPTGPDGALEETWFNFVYAPLRDPQGAIEGTLVSAFDVTDQICARRERGLALEEERRARQASEQARREIEVASETQRTLLEFQERFIAVLGHDLRNPLAAIEMGANVLRQRAAQIQDTASTRVIGRVMASSRRMSRMIEQILDLTRSRLGPGLTVNPWPMDLCTTLTTVVDELRTAHPERTLVLRCAPLHGIWDRDRLEQVFSNLIGNAIHHGSVHAPISVIVTEQGKQVAIDVHNEGEPIPEDLRELLFSPFRRGGRDVRTAKTAGLGLGLFISRELVTAHGGDLAIVGSSASEGTTFRVVLPRVTPEPRSTR